MSDFGWTDVLMDEDPVGNPTVHLPDDNEGKPELEEQGQPAAGDLPEDDTDPGMHDVPQGTDPNNGMKPGDYDNIMNDLTDDFEDKADEGDDEKEDEGEDDKSDDEDKKDDESEDKGDEEGETKDFFTDSFTDFDEDTTDFYDFEGDDPGQPKTDLPDDNEGKPELEEQGQPAAGDLPEDETDPGMKDVPDGTDPNNGMKSNDYDDVLDVLRDADDEETKDQGEDEGSDDDGASDDGDTKGEDDDKDEEVKDFADFFVDAGVAEPEGLPAGSDAEPADPVDQNGDDVCPVGEPNGLSKVNTPELIPVAGPAKDSFEDDDHRFSFFGDF